jgi:hypothetical protein
MWVTPEEIREYTDIKAVRERSDSKLRVDITRAEQYVITYTHNNFEDFDEVPEAVKTAVLILAEAYAHNSNISSREIKSETFDDYSYTAESTSISIESLDLAALLDDYVRVKPNNGVTMRMRKL